MTKFYATRSARTLATIALTLATVALWSGLTHAAEIECTATPKLPYGATVQLDSDCSTRPLLNGRRGETVRECATVRIVKVAYFQRVTAGKRVPFKGFCSKATAPGSIQYVSVIGN